MVKIWANWVLHGQQIDITPMGDSLKKSLLKGSSAYYIGSGINLSDKRRFLFAAYVGTCRPVARPAPFAFLEKMTNLKLVLVDDHEIVRIGLKLILKSWADVDVVGEASDGIEAVELVREKSPNVILLDLDMPNANGIEAARKIREFNKEVRIIMFTAHSDVRDILTALSAGINGYCLKDVDSERLHRAIWSVVDGDVWLDARATKDVLTMVGGGSVPPTFASPVNEKGREGAVQEKTVAPTGGVSIGAVPTGSGQGPYESLSARELEVLSLLVEGQTNKEIGERLHITRDTVKTHIRHIMEKLAASDRTDAAVKAIRHNIV